MKKEDVELIILKVNGDGQEAFNIKIYKNGTTCRSGVGGLPTLGIGLMTFVNGSRYFDPLIAKVPQEILDQPQNKEEPQTPNGYIEYILAFYGDSKNDDNGERADWSKSTGIRIKLDQQSDFFRHPIMRFLDVLTMDAAELTNELYFDAIMLAKWNAKSSTLPEQTLINHPKTDNEIHDNYVKYISQMIGSARKWDMNQFIKNKTYDIEGIKTIALINQQGYNFGIRFIPIDPGLSTANSIITPPEKNDDKKKKPWWKF